MTIVTMTVNGIPRSCDIEDRTLLVNFLRDNLALKGTHIGCNTSQCGACIVHINGQAVKSCTILAVHVQGADVKTIEGLAENGALHPVQDAFRAHHALQCGFCTPGMIMAAIDMIGRHGAPLTEATIRAELVGNICRCTGYHNIIRAIKAASEVMGPVGAATEEHDGGGKQ